MRDVLDGRRKREDTVDLDFVVWMEGEEDKRGLLGFFF